MVKRILLMLVVLVVLVAGVVSVLALRKPHEFKVERSVVISAVPGKIQPRINNFHNFGEWSPWEHLDPNMKRSYSGPPEGVGAIYEWTGDSKVGAGRMEIIESTPTLVRVKLDFLKPFASSSITTWTLAQNSDKTTVVWSMEGPMPFVSRVMSVFASMDAMIGGDFDRGLANLKKVSEQ